MKIFIGTNDTANVMFHFYKALNSLNYKVTALTFRSNKYFKDNNYYQHNLENTFLRWFPFAQKISTKKFELFFGIFRRIYVLLLLPYWIFKHDTFIFMTKSLLPSYIDLKIIKLFKKKIIWLFLGSEVRNTDAFLAEFTDVDRDNWLLEFKNDDIQNKLYLMRVVEKYADKIYSVPDQSSLAIKPYYLLNIPFTMEHIKVETNQRKIPVLLHAPTSTFIKGTYYFENAIEKLKEEHIHFHYKRIQGVSNDQLIKEIINADIILDECILQGPGLFGLESLAAGKIVLCRPTPGKSYPIIEVTPKTVYEKLKEIILDDKKRDKLAKLGRNSVSKFNDPKEIVKNMLFDINEVVVEPTFYYKYYFHIVQKSNNIKPKIKKLDKEILKSFLNSR